MAQSTNDKGKKHIVKQIGNILVKLVSSKIKKSKALKDGADDDHNIEQRFGKSGNTILDKFISERRLKWIPYDKFTNVIYLDRGGFSTIYKAIWLNMNQDKEVVLKCLNNLNENLDEFLNEWKYHQSCSNSYEIINLYGFTKSSDTLNYMVVMDYANKGNLRGNLAKVTKYNWKQKLNMLYKIISGLYEIHKQDLIHCDLHDGNILNHSNKKDEEEEENEVDNNLVFVSDLGLCQHVKSSLKKGEIYGVIPFMAPEVLRGKPYTPASDIYSFSMIMWEFTSGVPPFNDRTHDLQLSLSICKGERPKIIKNIPKYYMKLMKKCWNEDPLKRPTASEVKYIIGNWIFQPIGNGINEELENNKMEFINAQIGHNNLITESHPQACYTSRLLNFTSEKLNKILESGDSQSDSSTEDLSDCIIKDTNN
ncbi:kinase-like protein [Rhizophagus irregularis]|uniref:Kinase-like protein n=1 Tax=Rhizophagus irregularis TaxID=588596 RepID=A0A2N1MR71_9GLOM|nr:kinase-like protein [Rhizophagus irregularis]